jgi:hypothetical protein
MDRSGYLLVLYSLLIGVFLFYNVVPGMLVTDENAYSLMAHSLAHDGTLEIWNGLDEAQSWELLLPSMEITYNGTAAKMYAVPSPIYPFLAYPFFKVWDLSGLFIINILSYCIIIVLVYLMARLLLDEAHSVAAAVIYSLCTNSLVFTSYVLPHHLSAVLVISCVYLVFRGVRDMTEWLPLFFFSGLLGGLSVGVRFPNVLFVILLCAYLWLSQSRRMIAGFCIGLVIPLIAIGLIDYVSYGDFFETGYGNPTNFVKIKYLAIIPLLAGAYWLYNKRALGYRGFLAVSGIATVVLMAMFWDQVVFMATSVYGKVFNMDFDPGNDTVTYKKALLQSSPFLVLSAFSLMYIRRDRIGSIVGFMLALSMINILFYSTFSHGGSDETYSMRYFIESVPFLVILSVMSFSRLFGKLNGWEYCLFAVILVVISYLYLHYGEVVYSTDHFVRALPTLISLLCLGSLVMHARWGNQRALTFILLSVALAMAFSFSVADWLLQQKYNGLAYNLESQITRALPYDSAVFVSSRMTAIVLAPAKMSKHVRVAVSGIDGGADVPALVDIYVKRGIPVYYLNLNNENIGWPEFFGNISANYSQGKVTRIDAMAKWNS